MTGPRPYVPRLTRPAAAEEVGPVPKKPWMNQPDNYHRCWKCGHWEDDLDVLADHEDHCHG